VVVANIELSDLVDTNNVFSITKTDGTVLFEDIWLLADTNSSGTVVYSDTNNLEPFQIPKSITNVIVKGTIILVDTTFDIEVNINIEAPLSNNITKTGTSFTQSPHLLLMMGQQIQGEQ